MPLITGPCDERHFCRGCAGGSWKDKFGFRARTRRALSNAVLLSCPAAAMAVGAVNGAQVADIYRVLERLVGDGRQLFLAFFLRRQGVAGIAILADDFAVSADVVAVMATEASRSIEVTNVVGVRLPVDVHLGEERRAEDSLQLLGRSLDCIRLRAGDLGILLPGRRR